MPCDTSIFQDWANNSKVKDAMSVDGSTGEDPMDKTNCATSFFTFMVDRHFWTFMVEAVRDQNPKKFRWGHPLNNLVFKVKLYVAKKNFGAYLNLLVNLFLIALYLVLSLDFKDFYFHLRKRLCFFLQSLRNSSLSQFDLHLKSLRGIHWFITSM